MKQNRKTNSLLMLGIILVVLAVAGMACVGVVSADPTVDGGIKYELVDNKLTILVATAEEITEDDPETGNPYLPGKMKNYTATGPWGKNITSITFPDTGLKHIGNYAFQSCTSLTGNLTIPDSVTTIGASAFQGCNRLKGSLTIPDSVTTIGASAFQNCTKLDGTLTIGTSVTTIGASAFNGCSGLTGNLTIPNSVTTIGASAFQSCRSLKGTLTIGTSVTTIGISAFEGCNNLTGNLTIPDNVTTIGASAFYACNKLTGNLIIPNSVTTIGASAFQSCTGLKGTLTIGTSVTSIGDKAFNSCSGLTGNLTIPDNVTTIGDTAFAGCTGLNGTLTIGTSVTSIGISAFNGCSGLTGNLIIPNKVTTIGEYAFLNCKGLNGTLTIGTSVTSIGDTAFGGCSGLTGNLTIPNNVTTIGAYAFSGCTGLKGDVIIPNKVQTIDNGTFQSCSNLTSIVIPSGVSKILGSVLMGDTNMKYIMLNGKCDDNIEISADNLGEGKIGSFTLDKDRSQKINCVISSDLQTSVVMGKFMDGGLSDDTVWYITNIDGTNSISGDYDKYYMVVLNGGKLSNTFSQTGTSLPKPENGDVVKTGYKFDKWYTVEEGGVEKEYTGTTVEIGKPVYAKWNPNIYYVAFDANGGSGSMGKETFTYDADEKALSTNTFSRTGYTFAGWKSDSGKYYSDGAKVKNLTTENNATVTLYAQWRPNSYEVTLDDNGGTGGSGKVTATYDAAMPSITVPTKDGCNFVGYFDTAGTIYYNKDGSSARTWNKPNTDTLNAHWEKKGMYISETSISFGTIEQGEQTPKSKILIIQNTTDNTYTINYQKSGGFGYNPEQSSINPGETLNIEITPTGTEVGDYSDTITIIGEGDTKETIISYSITESGTSEKETVPDTPDVKTEKKLKDDGSVATEITAEGDDSEVNFDKEELTATIAKKDGNVVLTYTKATQTGDKSFEAGDGYTETAKYKDEAIIKADLQKTPMVVPYTLAIVLKENISSTEVPRMSGEFKDDVDDIVAKENFTALAMVTAVNINQLESINDTIKKVDITFKVPVTGVPDVSNIKVFHVKDEKAKEVELAGDITKDDTGTYWLVRISTDEGFSSYVIAKKNAEPTKGSSVTSFTGEKSGNDFTFSRSPVVIKATLPGVSTAKITKTTGDGWYSFKLDASGMSGNGTVYFQVPTSVLTVKNETVNDVSLVGYTTKYLTTENGYAKYSAVIPGEGTYTIDFVDNAAAQGTTEPKTEESTTTDTQGYLKVTSTPAGATIQIEGVNYKGTTPQSKIALNPGTYTVILSLDGYKDASKSFTIKAGETTPVTLTLEKKETTASETKTTEQTPTKTPVPVLGVLAGLGVAALFLRRR